jgi:hypothetical protein
VWFFENRWLEKKEPDMIITGVDYHPSDQEDHDWNGR